MAIIAVNIASVVRSQTSSALKYLYRNYNYRQKQYNNRLDCYSAENGFCLMSNWFLLANVWSRILCNCRRLLVFRSPIFSAIIRLFYSSLLKQCIITVIILGFVCERIFAFILPFNAIRLSIIYFTIIWKGIRAGIGIRRIRRNYSQNVHQLFIYLIKNNPILNRSCYHKPP